MFWGCGKEKVQIHLNSDSNSLIKNQVVLRTSKCANMFITLDSMYEEELSQILIPQFEIILSSSPFG